MTKLENNKMHCIADAVLLEAPCFCSAPTAENSDEMDVNLYSCAQFEIAALPSAEICLPKNILDDCFAIASI